MKPKRDIWFVSDDGDGIRPATRQGCRAFALAFAWIQLCGVGGMVAFALTWSVWCFVVMFVVCGAGLAVFARTVRRRS